MFKSRFTPPYNIHGKTNFHESIKKAGTYIIKENGIIVYIGSSRKNLYKTLYRHFQIWNHPEQLIVTYFKTLNKKKYTVRFVYCSPSQALRLEKALVLKHKPRDNRVNFVKHARKEKDNAILSIYRTCETYN